MSEERVEVSIIIPVYNKEKYLHQTLNSVVNQIFQDFEVIIINDGSTDDSLNVLEKYAHYDQRIKIYSIKNGGVSNARNFGLSQAKGRWIQFLDADDQIDKDYLYQAVAEGNRNKVDFVFSNFKMINESGNTVKNIFADEYGIYSQDSLIDSFMNKQYENGFFGYISNKLFQRNLLLKSNAKFPIDIVLAEDLSFYLNIYPYVKKCMFLNINSFYYVQTSDNYLLNESIDYRKQLEIQLQVKKWLIDKDKYKNYKSIIDQKISEYVSFIVFNDNDKGIDISNIFNEIHKNKFVFESLSTKHLSRINSRIINSIKGNKLKNLEIYFYFRNILRKVYRKVKKDE